MTNNTDYKTSNSKRDALLLAYHARNSHLQSDLLIASEYNELQCKQGYVAGCLTGGCDRNRGCDRVCDREGM
jgi:hypothetical protein